MKQSEPSFASRFLSATGALLLAGFTVHADPVVKAGAEAQTGGSDATSEAAASAAQAATAEAELSSSPLAPTETLEKLKAAMAEAEQRRQEAMEPDPAAPNAELREKWGVEVIGISRTAGGFMLDFRFRVLDIKKALPLFDHRVKPYVTAEKSGINLPVPIGAKTGAMRPTNRGQNIKADKTYYMIFANPDTHLNVGDTVTVVIGDFRVEHLTVN